MKDWTGNTKSIYTTLGASNHTENRREVNDFYATEPRAMELLLDLEQFSPNVWECACGAGHLSEVLKSRGYNVYSTDLFDRGYGISGVDFLMSQDAWNGDIISNPPYKYAKEFVEHALNLVEPGHKVAMFLKFTFAEGQGRRRLFETSPPKTVYISSSRLICAKNGDFDSISSSAVAYAWYIWEKGYTGDTVLKWFN